MKTVCEFCNGTGFMPEYANVPTIDGKETRVHAKYKCEHCVKGFVEEIDEHDDSEIEEDY